MDFGSKYVSAHLESEEEEISDGEIEDFVKGEVEALPPLPPRGIPNSKGTVRHTIKMPGHRHKKQSKSTKDKRKVYKSRRPDTNIISVKFGHLISPSNMHTGDPFYCDQCKAVFSHISTVSSQDTDKFWKCEFCLTGNMIDIEDEEKPMLSDITFMLNPASVSPDHQMVVFCIDTSGSMCVTTQVPSKPSRRDRRPQNREDVLQSRFLSSERHNVTYVSRLQAVQAAVGSQLNRMANENPHNRVAIVTFNNEVTLFGNEDTEEVHIAGDKLDNKEELIALGENLPLPASLQTTHQKLIHNLNNLEEEGQTALGPALLFSISLASQIKGSKVIICTDGKANVGLGNLDVDDEENLCKASEYYKEISHLAQDKGVSVSVITLKGTDCRLIELGEITVETGGQVNIVDPLKLDDEFQSILAEPIIATDVEATLILHKELYFISEGKSCWKVTKKLGNVTKNTEITFTFGVSKSFCEKLANGEERDDEQTAEASHQPAAEGASAASADVSGSQSELPFQLQIAYTDMKGSQMLRVITETKPVTTDKKTAEKEMNAKLVSVQGRRETADLAIQGKYLKSQITALQYRRYITLSGNDSAPSDACEWLQLTSRRVLCPALCLKQSSTNFCPDEAAKVLYKAKNSSSSPS